jgi:hypothetical protein
VGFSKNVFNFPDLSLPPYIPPVFENHMLTDNFFYIFFYVTYQRRKATTVKHEASTASAGLEQVRQQ